jgi:hypothetical protein
VQVATSGVFEWEAWEVTLLACKAGASGVLNETRRPRSSTTAPHNECSQNHLERSIENGQFGDVR